MLLFNIRVIRIIGIIDDSTITTISYIFLLNNNLLTLYVFFMYFVWAHNFFDDCFYWEQPG